jgi:hypothetical protein
MKRLCLLPATAVLLGLAACGGGSSSSSSSVVGTTAPPTTLGLAYENPTNPQGQFALYLLADPDAKPGNMVLDLVCPETTPAVAACGVSFGLELVDTALAQWVSSPAVTNGTVFTASGTQLTEGWVNSSGVRLQGIVANKGLGNPVADIGDGQGAVLAKIQLTPTKVTPAAGTSPWPVTLSDSGLAQFTDPTGAQYSLPILVGTLTLTAQ